MISIITPRGLASFSVSGYVVSVSKVSKVSIWEGGMGID